MAELKTAKYVREAPTRPSNHKEVTSPIPTLTSDENFGNLGFHSYWEAITKPFVIASDSHKHEFPQYITFLGGDITNMTDLGGEIELTLSEDGINTEKHIITRATTVYIPAGLYHGPLIFKKVTKPILFIDLYFAQKYERKT
jgi:hypothetical protein